MNMQRLTKASIQRLLLKGIPVEYRSAGKKQSVELAKPQSRRLFKYLLGSEVREAKELPSSFIEDLWKWHETGDDPATEVPSSQAAAASASKTWYIKRVTTMNFGGLNLYAGDEFVWEVEKRSWLLDGENGSGKSSLLGAIAWAFTGNRPRDELAAAAHVHAPVMDVADKKVGTWPPLAAYPSTAAELQQLPRVVVKVDLVGADGEEASLQRTFADGEVSYSTTGDFHVDEVFISTSIEMPMLLAGIRLKEKSGEGNLTRAVTQLTGLEELENLGELVEGLCNGAREYASYAKKNGLAGKALEHDAAVESAKAALNLIGETWPASSVKEQATKDGPVATLGLRLKSSATEMTDALKADLADGVDTSDSQVQRDIAVAMTTAKEALDDGLVKVAEWVALEDLATVLTPEAIEDLETELELAELQIEEALGYHKRQTLDHRFQLKASAAAWHANHGSGGIEACPLCERAMDGLDELKAELEALRDAREAARQSLAANLASIQNKLTTGAASVAFSRAKLAASEPRVVLLEAISKKFTGGHARGQLLKTLQELVASALSEAPEATVVWPPELPAATNATLELNGLLSTMQQLRKVIAVARWFEEVSDDWLAWWAQLNVEPLDAAQGDDKTGETAETAEGVEAAGAREVPLNAVLASASVDGTTELTGSPVAAENALLGLKRETVRSHISRIDKAVTNAQPYSQAVEELRKVMKLAKELHGLQEEKERRDKVVDALMPLKQLTGLAQAVAQQAILELSERIKAILQDMHAGERFQYQIATLQKRDGLSIRGSFTPELRIDSSLVANTSWLRSTLWAFVFALRAEAVELAGRDSLPVWLFDDPQATFDLGHRLNWSSHVAAMQKASAPAQVLLATHDATFAAKLKSSEFQCTEGYISAASEQSGPLMVLEGSLVERSWKEADADRQSKAKAARFLSDSRIYLEGMLKAMLSGHGHQIKGMALTALKDYMVELGRQGREPWDKPAFGGLAEHLSKPAFGAVTEAHHTESDQLRYAEAKRVWMEWPTEKLRECYQEARDHRLLHGMPSAFHLRPPEAELPDGFAPVIKEASLSILGRAAAFSGRISDGTLNYQAFESADVKSVRLAQHSAYRLTARTMEPVARAGDILLVHESIEPQPRSLVVAAVKDQLLARRFVVSEASSSVAVLTANALDPHEIALPVVARKESIKLRAVVGVLFDSSAQPPVDGNEIVACDGESSVRSILARCSGLIEVVGQSAQPLALDKQHLFLGEQVQDARDLRRLDGVPVIAADSENNWYFKRLRLATPELFILESLDGGGEYPPEVLWAQGSGKRSLAHVWEVLGVLFEMPSRRRDRNE